MNRWIGWTIGGLCAFGFMLIVPAMALADNCSGLIDCFGSGGAATAGAAGAGALAGGLAGGLGRGPTRTMPGVGTDREQAGGSNVPRDAPTGPSGPEREYARQQREQQERAAREAQRAREATIEAREEGAFEQGAPPDTGMGATDEFHGEGARAPGSNVGRDDDTRPR